MDRPLHAVYDVLLPIGQRYTGKDETHGIERDNARQRHWLARFRRRSIVVSKAKRRVGGSIALIARFAGNDRIADLIAMLASNPQAVQGGAQPAASSAASSVRLAV